MADHVHVWGVEMTGPAVAISEDEHYHILSDGGRTSANPTGIRHTHTYKGIKTGPLIVINSNNKNI